MHSAWPPLAPTCKLSYFVMLVYILLQCCNKFDIIFWPFLQTLQRIELLNLNCIFRDGLCVYTCISVSAGNFTCAVRGTSAFLSANLIGQQPAFMITPSLCLYLNGQGVQTEHIYVLGIMACRCITYYELL